MDEQFGEDMDMDNELEEKLYGEKNTKKLLMIIIFIFITIICLILSTFLFFNFFTFNKEDSKPPLQQDFTVLMSENKIHKPYTYKLSSEVIKLKNGIKAILVSEPNSTSSGISILSYYGSALDVIQGLAHFSEHMAFRGSKKHRDNKLWTGFNYPGVINDAFTVMENTCFYISTEVYSIFEQFLDMISDALHNPLLNSSVIKNEINVVNSEYLLGNRTDEYILNVILGELINENHPIYRHLSFGNNKTLNHEDMVKYLRAYFQEAFHPNNLNIALYSNKSISDLEKLVVKYFNYEIKVDENENVGNKERIEKRKKLKEERLFKKENGGKIIKYFSKVANNFDESDKYYNLLSISFGINNMTYKDGFNPIDFLNYLLKNSKDSYLSKYLIDKNYIYMMTPKIFNQFFDTDFGFYNIYIYLNDQGVNNLEEVIKAVFHYLNLIKNSMDEIEKNIFPNYQKLKENMFNYYYDENKIINNENRRYILNMKKHGMENIFRNDVPDKFDKNFFLSFLNDNINIENAIISLNSNYDISKIKLFEGHSIKYLNHYGNQYNITNLKKEFIELLNKFPVDQNYIDSIKLRKANIYLTNISNPTKPCYLTSKEECEKKKEFNPLLEKEYNLKNNCSNSSNHLCYYVNDRSLNFPKVKIVLKVKSDNEIIPYLQKAYYKDFYLVPLLNSYFDNFMEDPNNRFSITYDNELIITIDTYKDLVVAFFEKFIDRIFNIFTEEEFNKEKNKIIFGLYTKIGAGYLNINEYNTGVILDLLDYGFTSNYPNFGYVIIERIKSFKYENITQIHPNFINSLIEYTKLYLFGDLDESIITQINSIVQNKIKLKAIQVNNLKYNTLFSNVEENKDTSNQKRILNEFSNIIKKEIQNNTVVNYIYKNNNPYEKESFTGLFYNIKMLESKYNFHFNLFVYLITEKIFTELRSKKGLCYHSLVNFKISTIKNKYLYIFVEGAMKTPIQIQYDIQSVISDILTNWKPDNFEEVKRIYKDRLELFNAKNTFEKRVNKFISELKNKGNDLMDEYPKDFNEVIKGIKNIFLYPIRIGIFEYANYIDSDFIKQEIKSRENEKYFLNQNISVIYTQDINYFK